MKTHEKIFGNDTDRMTPRGYRFMSMFFSFYYLFKPAKKYLATFGIQPGWRVVDMGCGPGYFIRPASKAAGEKGVVYAVDILEEAILDVQVKVLRKRLPNVIPLLYDGVRVPIADGIVDLTFAIDMFHMVRDHVQFLREIRRFTKEKGILIIEDGHQPRETSREKILESGAWRIEEENSKFMRCIAV